MNLPTNPVGNRAVVRHGDGAVGLRVADEDPRLAPQPAPISTWRAILSGFIQLAAAIAILAAGFMVYQSILASAPKAQRKPPGRVARLVDVVPVEAARAGPVIEAWGEVVAARTLVVRPEISGTVTWVDPQVTPGGRLTAGAVVARFDDADLKLAVARAETEIAGIDARIKLEEGQAAIGQRELTRLTRNLTDQQRSLVLREPQMAQLRAERAAAVASRDQALNALERAEVRAPFDALVLSEFVAPGAMLAQGAEAATLVASDRFHVTLAVPAASLRWLRFDGTQMVRLTQTGAWPDGASRTGRIARFASALTETGRMVEVIVEIEDPLALRPENASAPALLLGSFVKGTIEIAPIDGTVRLDRAHLRDDDTVWVMNAKGELEVRRIEIAWRGPDQVLVRGGLLRGERVVATALATHAPGMALRTRDLAAEASAAAATPATGTDQ